MVFNTAISGIQAATKDLEVTGNNIANSSTIGFKNSRAEFADVYGHSNYGIGTNAVGGGVRLSRIHQSFASGNITATNNTLDLAINGTGFFILSDQGAKTYTRAGQFKLDDNNFIVNGNGNRLQGLLAEKGVVTGAAGDLKINTANISPNASSNISAGLNLYGKSKAPDLNWSGGTSPPASTYNNVTSSTVYDSLGNSHVLSMYFIKSDPDVASTSPNSSVPAGDPTTTPPTAGMENQWFVAFQIDGQDVPAITPGQANTGNLYRVNFNSDGSYSSVVDNTNVTSNADIGVIPLTCNLNNGSNPLKLNIDFSNSSQYGSPFAVQSLGNDGYTTGSLAGLDIDGTGVVLGRYTNGQSLAMGQIQLANFADPESMQNLGGCCWAETINSGQPIVSAAGTGGMGLIDSGALEESNVDLTSELVHLISAQRNFQANAQTIRTADAITQTIINIR